MRAVWIGAQRPVSTTTWRALKGARKSLRPEANPILATFALNADLMREMGQLLETVSIAFVWCFTLICREKETFLKKCGFCCTCSLHLLMELTLRIGWQSKMLKDWAVRRLLIGADGQTRRSGTAAKWPRAIRLQPPVKANFSTDHAQNCNGFWEKRKKAGISLSNLWKQILLVKMLP